MNPPANRWPRKALSFLIPTTKLNNPTWKEIWTSLEKKRFRHLARLFFLLSTFAYVLHFFFIDMRLGKTPLELWASYRFGLAGFALLGFLLTLNRRFCFSGYYKLPMILAGYLFSYMQVKTMVWSHEIPYFYAFIIPCLTAVILRLNLVSSVLYILSIHILQFPNFMEAGIETHLLLSATTVSVMTVIVFRANMLGDVNAFMSEQMKDEMQIKLNAALNETKKKEKALAQTNQLLLRKTQIFKTLLESSTNLLHFQDVRDLLSYAAKEFESLFKGCGILLIVSDQETQLLGEAVAINVNSQIKQQIVNNYSKILDKDYLSELRYQLFIEERVQYPHETVMAIPMTSSADKNVGTAVMIGVGPEQQSAETIALFLALITSCAENLSLTKKLEYLAHTDKLTTTYNRNYFERELKRYVRTNHEFPELHFTLLLIDVNGLKQVNDFYGHKEGDNLIVKVAGVLKGTCRKTDLVFRLGGDEFVILCPETKDANRLIERLRRRERNLRIHFQTASGHQVEIPVTMSIGIASSAQHAPDTVLRVADEMMYEDKRQFYSYKRLKKTS